MTYKIQWGILEKRKEVFIILYNTFIQNSGTCLKQYFFDNKLPLSTNQFSFNKTNIESYKQMYLNQRKSSPDDLKEYIYDLENTCKECKSFHRTKTQSYNHSKNVATGIFLEHKFLNFLNERINFNAELTTTFQLVDFKGNEIPQDKIKIFPDISILDEQRYLVAFIELKYHSAPFIKAKDYTGYYCYEGSLSMDVLKVKNQLNQLNQHFPETPTFYLHWIDFPCIKGFFIESSFQVTESLENPVLFSKATQYNEKKTNAHKFYTDFYTLTTLDEFINFLNLDI